MSKCSLVFGINGIIHKCFCYCSSVDKAHLKLASAKAVLRLSKHWDQKIPVDVFHLTIRTPEVKLFKIFSTSSNCAVKCYCFSCM